jgi:hypothetical protein
MAQTLRVYSWPQALTQWGVIQAFRRAGCPGFLRRPAVLSVAFVAEVSAALRFRTLSYRSAEIIGLCQAAAESAYEAACGSAYVAARAAARAAESMFLGSLRQVDMRAGNLAERERCEAALAALRAKFSKEAAAAQHRSARRYWTEQAQQWLTDDLLTHLRRDPPLCWMADFAPDWWRHCVACLHNKFSRCHIPSFHVLDELPFLRRRAGRARAKVLAAVVEEWRDAHADELGLPARLHYHVLARRSAAKVRRVTRWLNTRAPRYTLNPNAEATLQAVMLDYAANLPVPPEDYSAN